MQKTVFDGHTIVTSDKEKYTLTASQLQGSGGQAEVYAISDRTAVKIYFDSLTAQGLSSSLKAKLTMLSAPGSKAHENVILPRSLIYLVNNNSLCGFTLRLLNGAKQLNHSMWKLGLNRSEEAELDIINAGFLFDICDALEALHENRIFYSDLKPENILITDQQAYLVDFDSCSIQDYQGNCMTIDYVDPLLRINDPAGKGPYRFNAGSDWWALAVIAFGLFMGVSPWDGISDRKKYKEGERSFNHVVIGFDPTIRTGPKDNPLMRMRPMNWFDNKPKLLRYFKDIFSPTNKKRLSIAGALETYFPRPERKTLRPELSKKLAELEVLTKKSLAELKLLKQMGGEEDIWEELGERIEELSQIKGEDRDFEGDEQFLAMMAER